MSAHLRPCYILRFSAFHFHFLETRHSQPQYLLFDVSVFREKRLIVINEIRQISRKKIDFAKKKSTEARSEIA